MKWTKKQKKQRILMMLTGAFAIFFTGYPHVWSVYQPYVMELGGWTREQASMCFYLALGTFVFGNIAGGRIQDRYNPKIAIWVGGGIFTAGILLSAFLIQPSPLPLYFTYGFMQGFGQGMIYTTIVSTAQKWFPGRAGFASGIVVTANGLCGFFLAPISRSLLETSGPKLTFLFIGLAIMVSWILCGLFFCAPDKQWVREAQAKVDKATAAVGQKQYTSSEMIRTRTFYCLLGTMLFGLVPYFMVSPVSQSYQIELGITPDIAVMAVMIGSILNAGTRLVLPSLADKVGRSVCIKGVLAVAAVTMFLLSRSHSYLTTVTITVMYGCYGGLMGSFPSFTSSIFGIEHSGENYGYVMFGIVIATFGAPIITGIVTGRGYGMPVVFAIGSAFAVAAYVCLQLLKKELNREKGGETLHL